MIPIPDSHIYGNYDWIKEHKCCDEFKTAIEEFIFVSNTVDLDNMNAVYMLPADSEGKIYRKKGIPIQFCPWCGKKIEVRKKLRE